MEGLGERGQILTGLSILIAGKNTFGYTDDGTKLPEFEFEFVNEQSTGIVKQPVMTLAINNLHARYIAHLNAGLSVILKGNTRIDGKDTPLLLTVSGTVKKMSAEVKVGDAVKREFEINLETYTEVVDNISAIVYTRFPYSYIVGGVDMAPDFNNNI